jgi:hypothetical protein
MKLIDLSGKSFGRWFVSDYAGKSYWNCVCECGTVRKVNGKNLTLGTSSSCGCYVAEINTKHGMSRTRVYSIWEGMKQRCTNPKNKNYHLYGGAGVVVCEEWLIFENFYRDMGTPPFLNAQLDRRRPIKGYNKENCRWITPSENNYNRRGSRKPKGGLPRGVSKVNGSYVAKIRINKIAYYLGCYKDPNDAHEAYRLVANEWYGYIP